MARLVRSSISRHLYEVPGGYEVISVESSVVRVKILVADLTRDERRWWQFGDPVVLPRSGVMRAAETIQGVSR